MNQPQENEVKPVKMFAVVIERWLPVVGYEGKYDVSNHGRVRSLILRNKVVCKKLDIPRILKPLNSFGGYKRVQLCKDNKIKNELVHKLVLESFVCKRPCKKQCGHLNGNPGDNRLENLSWITSKENQSHKRIHGTHIMGDLHPQTKIRSVDIPVIGSLIKRGITQLEISRIFKVSIGTIYNAVRGNNAGNNLTKNI